MNKLSFDVEGLTEEQIELARQFIELLEQVTDRERAFANLEGLLQKGVKEGEEIPEEEANNIGAEAVAHCENDHFR